eukprot:gene9096-10664_t
MASRLSTTSTLRVVIGPNGAGKTTVLDLICGKTRATSGSIQFDGQELTKMREYNIVRAGVGRKFQNPSIYENLTVFENLEMSYPAGRKVWGALFFKRNAQVIARVEEVAREIFLGDLLQQQADLLSHGQKQWLEIGMLLMQDPELLMLDEPVAGMSVNERVQTAELLKRISQGRSVLVIEHDMEFVKSIAHKVTVLHQGKVLAEGSMESVQSNPKVIESGMFKIDKLSCGYGQSQILHDLELDVAKREIVAVMGRNGMGKTTLFKSLMGILPQWQGQVSVDGHDVSALETHERVERGIAYVPQGRMIFPSMSVLENIQTGLPAAARGRVPEDLYALFPVLYDMRSRKGGNLSGGQQQQLAIARALATNPKVLLLDEPTEGIQPSIIKDIARTLKEIRNLRDLTIVVSEQVLSFTLEIADRFLVIEKGRFVIEEIRDRVDEATIS